MAMAAELFDELPFEVFVDFILPRIGVKELGALSQLNSSWRDMCSEQDVWRRIYMRGLNFRITDTSVHIGPRHGHHKVVGHQASDWRAKAQHDSTRRCAWYSYATVDPIIQCLPCLPADLKATLLPWSTVRKDGGTSDCLSELSVEYPTRRAAINASVATYLDYVEVKWTNYNAAKGLSTVNLCQCTGHYQFGTLAGPTNCRNSKSFKKVVLKKHLTVAKRSAKQNSSIVAKQLKDIMRFREHVAKLEAELYAAELAALSSITLCDKLVQATQK